MTNNSMRESKNRALGALWDMSEFLSDGQNLIWEEEKVEVRRKRRARRVLQLIVWSLRVRRSKKMNLVSKYLLQACCCFCSSVSKSLATDLDSLLSRQPKKNPSLTPNPFPVAALGASLNILDWWQLPLQVNHLKDLIYWFEQQSIKPYRFVARFLIASSFLMMMVPT